MRRIAKWMAGMAALTMLAGSIPAAYTLGLRRGREKAEAVPVSMDLEEADSLTRFRTEREQLRARQSAELNEIIYSTQGDGELILQAQRQLLDMLETAQRELTLEGILQARGFGDALVTVNPNSVNVLVRSEDLTARETAVILELVLRETGVTGGNVKIIPIK